MTIVKRRVRRSTGGRWTAKERDLLLRLGSQPHKVSWRLIQAVHFPTRTVDAVQKQFSDVRKLQREKDMMSKNNDAGSPSTPSRVSTRKRLNPPSTDSTGEPAPKQTKIIEPVLDSGSEYEEGSDSATDDDGESILPDGSRTLRNRQRNSTQTDHQARPDASEDTSSFSRPSQIVKMSLVKGEKGKSALQVADKQPERPIGQSLAPSNPQRIVSPQNAEASAQSSGKTADISNTSSQGKSAEAKDISGGSGDAGDSFYSMINNWKSWLALVENERIQRCLGNLKIQELNRVMASQNGKITDLEDRLKQKEDEIHKLNTELQKEKDRNARERADNTNMARPCSDCTKNEKLREILRSHLDSLSDHR